MYAVQERRITLAPPEVGKCIQKRNLASQYSLWPVDDLT